MHLYTQTQRTVIELARSWHRSQVVIVDVETTGLDEDAEIIEIAMTTVDGTPIMNTLVKPIKPVPDHITALTGITTEMLADAPTWNEVHHRFWMLVAGKQVLTYGLTFDLTRIIQNSLMHGLCVPASVDQGDQDQFTILDDGSHWNCVMRAYAQVWAEPTVKANSTNGCRWKKLSVACEDQRATVERAHRAFADCRMVGSLITAMANEPKSFIGCQQVS